MPAISGTRSSEKHAPQQVNICPEHSRMSDYIASSAALRKKKTLKKSINFSVMVVGSSGSGRSTFINSLCDQQIVDISANRLPGPQEFDPDSPMGSLFQLRRSNVELEDNEGVRISLNIIDTPGFGRGVENLSQFEVILNYIKHQYDEILIEESKLKRNPRFKDGRVHCCLYLVEATGHGLREIDVELMKQLSTLINLIPVISKSDSLTETELQLNKRLIREDLTFYGIPVYDFNDEFFQIDKESDYESYQIAQYLNNSVPFAVMGSNKVIDTADPATGHRRVREYPWGLVDVDDNAVSELSVLRNTLLISHLNDFKEYTHEVLYENYRAQALGNDDRYEPDGLIDSNRSPISYSRDQSQFDAATKPLVADSYLAREEQIRLEEERLRVFEERVQSDLLRKRQELEEREKELADIERRLASGAIDV
ncbi:BA75_03538T0 [Komagataella pastoris]|uniref:BA75_03538T0 n=1 Tax=Komagataella pastoris TaxID=4922 RepID=A0A1B2JF07_PICPA|nr:BA75_03538T0 [Komagataella pastoris]